ncbi:Xaa-Pro dipeptidyl-peptidase [Streptococcus sp. DD12]|uniref:Xaa-Pro dipeptidyl-peptidase n=1 Tax=Streptococcus sp. DD12 TaxID=1777880 RepID=UPI00079811E6|nr:Xaa-Pro dipeptidyl-peptidase [Streptococcus sp. DD12]KXT75701.1 Xaa-Pro dipeptidyl-peptidase [Streptococcus sp. DD12]
MRYNVFSYIPTHSQKANEELVGLGFASQEGLTEKSLFFAYLNHILQLDGKDQALGFGDWLATDCQDAWDFFQSDAPLTDEVFTTIALQLLGFVPGLDYKDLKQFREKMAFPIDFASEGLVLAFYHLLNSRTVRGNLLVDELVANGLIPLSNQPVFFNDKLLASYDTKDLVREMVYVQTPVRSEGSDQAERVKVLVIRPRQASQLPTVMTASPYHMGTNDKASDDCLHKMAGSLTVKKAGLIQTNLPDWPVQESPQVTVSKAKPATEHFYDTDTYTLNDYFLARGMANLYVSGIGTAGSQGFMTTGDAKQVASFKAVIDWLNGRATAYSQKIGGHPVLADWANGRVVTTGKSYLGTLSTALATTGVKGLEAIIAESAISSWYDYYRENGLVKSPGGYPGEDLDTLTALTYSRSLVAGDFLKQKTNYEKLLKDQQAQLDRQTGDYSQFWADRNYRPFAKNVSCLAIYTHGLQDWNVAPKQVYDIFNALPDGLEKHAFLHHGEHVYLNNWQSIDFKETMNALLAQRLVNGKKSALALAPVLWQDNQAEQSWQSLDQFGGQETYDLTLGAGQVTIANAYPQEAFKRYDGQFREFKSDLFSGKITEQAVTLPLTIEKDLLLNGKAQLKLRLSSDQAIGLLSVQLLHVGKQKRFGDIPTNVQLNAIDNGRHFKKEALKELPFKPTNERVMTKGHLNLQNREGLLSIQDIIPQKEMTINLELEPTIYRLKAGDQLALILYTTDFEHTVRDNQNYHLTLDLDQATLHLPIT